MRWTKGLARNRPSAAEGSVERMVRDDAVVWPLADETDSARLVGKPVIGLRAADDLLGSWSGSDAAFAFLPAAATAASTTAEALPLSLARCRREKVLDALLLDCVGVCATAGEEGGGTWEEEEKEEEEAEAAAAADDAGGDEEMLAPTLVLILPTLGLEVVAALAVLVLVAAAVAAAVLALALAAEVAGLRRGLALSSPTEALAAGPWALELELVLDSCELEWLLELRECRCELELGSVAASDVDWGRRACLSRRAVLEALLSRGTGAATLLE